MDFVYLCIRVPKSGSISLNDALAATFADQRTFFLPDSLNLDGRYSAFQRWRFRRARNGNLRRHYGDPRLEHALEVINTEAQPGDLISGGHFDFDFARSVVKTPAKIITLLRHPVARCVSEYNYARHSYLSHNIFRRLDSKTQPKIAARYSLAGYLDYLLERRETYGDLASQYIGWEGTRPLPAFFAANVFHAGVLEEKAAFAFGLSEKLGRAVDLPWSNSTVSRETLDAGSEERRRIERLYAKDFELYEYQFSETRRGLVRRSGHAAAGEGVAGERPAAPGLAASTH